MISHLTTDLDATSVSNAASSLDDKGSTVRPRRRAQVEAFFDGLQLMEPGLTLVEEWQSAAADSSVPVLPATEPSTPVPMYVGVARKP